MYNVHKTIERFTIFFSEFSKRLYAFKIESPIYATLNKLCYANRVDWAMFDICSMLNIKRNPIPFSSILQTVEIHSPSALYVFARTVHRIMWGCTATSLFYVFIQVHERVFSWWFCVSIHSMSSGYSVYGLLFFFHTLYHWK